MERRVRDMTSTKPDSLYVRQLQLGPMKNFVYLIGAATGSEAVVVDPAWDVSAIVAALAEDQRRLSAIFLTHHHHDHLNGVPDLLSLWDVPVHVQRTECDFALDALRPFAEALAPTSPGQLLHVAGVDLKCLYTPGHTPGSQCLECGGSVFTGDTLFVNACGRCDFEGSDPRAMHDSLFNVLGRLPPQTVVYPGHDYGDVAVSTLGREWQNNPYYKRADVDAFVKYRLTPRG
jgi:hydroxyacylglutathione hydrolase